LSERLKYVTLGQKVEFFFLFIRFQSSKRHLFSHFRMLHLSCINVRGWYDDKKIALCSICLDLHDDFGAAVCCDRSGACSTRRTIDAFEDSRANSRTIAGRVVPTTTNPTINVANGGSRIVANTSFELQANSGMVCESAMRGWLTTHPVQGSCRVFEVWTKNAANDSLIGNGAPDGTYYIELNAFTVSMAYQPICMVGGESFDFEFYHHVRNWSDTNTIEFRFGIPSGLSAGSKSSDSYSRQIMRGVNVQGGSGSTATASVTSYTGTTGTAAVVQAAPIKNWVKFSGTHAIDASFGGVRNLGFFGILPAGASANLVDQVSVDFIPLVDLGTSRDQTADEQGSPTAMNVRINGRVAAGTKIALRRKTADPGDAVSDTDFSLGTVTAGVNGTATVTHTAGSNVWLIEVPAGDYDGGLIAANNQGWADHSGDLRI
jgi:hypothetical protein